MVTLTVRVVDAETDKVIDTLLWKGLAVRPSVVILPASAPLPGAELASDAAADLLTDPSNGPILPGEPSEKPVTGTPGFSAFAPHLAALPRIYRVDPPALTLDLGLIQGDTAGFFVAILPPESDEWDFFPRAELVTKDDVVVFTAFRKDLSPLAKEVLKKRAKAKPELELAKKEWGGESAFVWDMIHSFVENTMPPKDARLAAYWIDDLSWAVVDFAIPAREFDLLVDRYSRVRRILDAVPWPDIPFFTRCAYGIPVTISKTGAPLTILNHRLYVPSFSDYFPREDAQIKTDLGLLWMANLEAIFKCVVKKFQEKAEEAEKSKRFWKFVSVLAPALLFPTPAALVGAVSDMAMATFLANVNPLLLQAIGLAQGALLSLVTGGVALTGLDAIASKVFDQLVEQLKAMLEAQGLKDLQELAKDAEKLQAFIQGATGLGEIPPVLAPFLAWCLRVAILDVLLAALFSTLSGGSVSPQGDITVPLLESAVNAGVEVPDSVTDLVNGEDPNFPNDVPPSVTPATGAVAGTAFAVATAAAGYLHFAGRG